MMATRTLVVLLVVLCCVALNSGEDRKKGGKAKKEQKEASLTQTTPISLAASISGIDSTPYFPPTLQYDLEVEDHGTVGLELHLNPFMHVPSRSGRNQTRRYDTAFYTDVNGYGSFACRLNSGDVSCEISALITYGDETCYFVAGDAAAECTPAEEGVPLKYYTAPDVQVPRINRKQKRKQRSVLPVPGHKTVEIAFIADRAFMSIFYARHSTVQAAEEEADVFITLLANEMNVFYSTVSEVSGGALDLYVYPADFVYPEYGTDFPWARKHNDGTYLYVEEPLDKALRKFVNSGFSTKKWDHAMALSGLGLYQYGSRLLGYAYLSTVCDKASQYKYSINEYTTWSVARIAAHELGHGLSADHDESRACPTNTNVMSAGIFDVTKATSNTYHYFSTCSVNAFQRHLNSYPDCTMDNGFTDKQFADFFCSGVLGQRDTNLDKQCQTATRYAGSVACNAISGNKGCYEKEQVSCTNARGKCNVMLGFVWNGTPCGTDKFCHKGQCVTEFSICGTTTTTTTTTTTQAPTTTAATCDCCSKKKAKNRKKCCKRGLRDQNLVCACCE